MSLNAGSSNQYMLEKRAHHVGLLFAQLRAFCACMSLCIFACTILSAPLMFTQNAYAGPSSLLVDFGETYGHNVRHSGIDIFAEPHSSVLAPVSGVVSFCGDVPKTSGLRIKALTIQTDAGDLVTVSPIEDAIFRKGDIISEGAVLGKVAPFGDPSVDEAHVHMSLRVEKKYVDPSGLIGNLGIDVQESKVKTTAFVSTTPARTQQPREHVQKHTSSSAYGHVTVREPQTRSAQETNLAHASSQAPTFSMNGLHNENQLLRFSSYKPMSEGGVTVNTHIQVVKSAPLSRTTLAYIFFLSGLTLTFAGWGGYMCLDGKFDLARKIGQLAVRGQR